MANGKKKFNPVLLIVLAVAALLLADSMGYISLGKDDGGTGIQPTTTVDPSGDSVNMFVTAVDLLVDTKDPVALASDNTVIQPNVTIRYFREGSGNKYVQVAHAGGTQTNISLNPGEKVRLVWWNNSVATGSPVYLEEMTVTTPKDVRQMVVEMPTRIAGSASLAAFWNGESSTNFTIASGAKDTNKLKLEIANTGSRTSFLDPKIVISYDKDAYDSIKLYQGGKELEKFSLPDRLEPPVLSAGTNATTTSGEYYQVMYGGIAASVDDYAVLPKIDVHLDAKTVTWSDANVNASFRLLDTSNYFGKDGTTVYNDVETAELDTIVEIASSACDYNLSMQNGPTS